VYVPRHFSNDDRALAVKAMRQQSFAILVSVGEDGEPFATHCPLVVDDAGTRIVGHIARANPHWKRWHDGARVLAIFPGPHVYISPSLYQNPLSVPTWNYVAVHAAGLVTIRESKAQREAALEQLIDQHEPAFIHQWRAMPDDFRGKLLDAIVAFEIAIDRLEPKYKLGQNRPQTDRTAMFEHLSNGGDDARGIAGWMKQLESEAA
jgi:transcriptional regulator